MDTKKFLNSYQPSMLQNATILLYINAVFSILNFGPGLLGIVALVSLAGAAGGYGIANDKKWGHYIGIAAAVIPLAFWIYAPFSDVYNVTFFSTVISILFKAALLVLLLHPTSKGYVKTWFK